MTNAAFCDGHAESIPTRHTQNSNGAQNVAKATGFLSSDNSAYGAQSPLVNGWVAD